MKELLSDELESSVDQGEDLLDSSAADPAARLRLQDRAREVRDRLNVILAGLGSKAEVAEQAIKDQYAKAEASMKEGIELTETKIKERPFTAVGIAAGVGIILGLLINRNR